MWMLRTQLMGNVRFVCLYAIFKEEGLKCVKCKFIKH